MRVTRKRVLVTVVLGLVAGGIALAKTTGNREEHETPITGAALEKASAAALAYIGGGAVTETEVGDEEGAYEVEVTKDGREIDVHLDANFNVISSEDEDGSDDGDGH